MVDIYEAVMFPNDTLIIYQNVWRQLGVEEKSELLGAFYSSLWINKYGFRSENASGWYLVFRYPISKEYRDGFRREGVA